jgi:hypothetical protein
LTAQIADRKVSGTGETISTMAIVERKADDGGVNFEVECDAEGCGQWMPLRRRDLAFGPTLGPTVDWHQADDGRTYCPEHAPA